MILTDASVVIAYSRRKDAKLAALVKSLPVAVCGVTRAELLRGVRTVAERADTVATLDSFVQLPTPESVWDAVGDHLAALRAAGLAVPFQDVVVATVGVAFDVAVRAWDWHFPLLVPHLPGLRLFVEP